MGQYQKFLFDNFVIKCDDDTCAAEVLDTTSEDEIEPSVEVEISTPEEVEIAEVEYVTEAQETPEPDKSYTQEEVNELLKRAEEKGYERGFQSAAQDVDQQTCTVLEGLNTRLITMLADAQSNATRQEQEVLNLSKKIVLHVLPELDEQVALTAINNFLTMNFPNFSKEPKLSFYFSPDIIKNVQETIAKLAGSNDFEGKISLHKDSTLSLSDCRIEWENGGVEKNMHKMLEKVSILLDDETKNNRQQEERA